MARRRVKHLRQKILDRLRGNPLEAVLAITAPTAVLAVAARAVGRWVVDAALVVAVVIVVGPTVRHVLACASARGGRLRYSEAILWRAAQIVGCLIGGCWDVALLWLSPRRRAIARYQNTCRWAKIDPIPTVLSWRETLEGDEYVVAVHPGIGDSTAELCTKEVVLQDAAGSQCRRVRIARLDEGGQCIITFVYRDPLTIVRLGKPPVATTERTDIRKPVEVGRDEHGKPVLVDLWKRHLLVGGLPDMGKSTFMAQLVAHAALAPNARIWFVDAKNGIEASVWEHTCDRIAYDPPDAVVLIRELSDLMGERLSRVAESDTDQHQPTANDPAIVLVIDELAEITVPTQAHVRRIMSLGRAASIGVIDATQRPHNKLVDTNMRALHHTAVAFGCRDENESDLILGEGMAGRGYDASTISTAGEFFLVGAQSRPLRCKAYNFDRELRRSVAARCAPAARSVPQFAPPVGLPQSAPSEQEPSPGGAAIGTGADQPPPAAPDGPTFPGAPQQAKAYAVLAGAPNGLTHGQWLEAAKVTKDTLQKVIDKCDGRWIKNELGVYRTTFRAGDVAA